jgi:hypothetical protein
MAKEMFQNFVEKEIMPVRQQVDDDKEHEIVNKILQGLTDLETQNAALPKEFRAAKEGVDAELMHNNVIAARILTGALAVGNAQGALTYVADITIVNCKCAEKTPRGYSPPLYSER